MTTNIRLSEAIVEYQEHMKSRDMAPRTIHNHMQVLRRGLAVWGDIYVASIQPGHIDRLFATQSWGPKTRNLYLSNLRSGFLTWCRRHNYMRKDYDPTDGWRNAKVVRREQPRIGVEMFPDLLDAAGTLRDRAIIALGLFTMARGSEITNIKIKDLDFDNSTVFLYRQKTKEEDIMPMSLELREEMLAWLAHYREQQNGYLDPDWYVIPACKPLPMAWDPAVCKLQPTGAPPPYVPFQRVRKPYDAVKRAMRNLGLEDYRAGIHLTRRSSARAYYDLLVAQGFDHAILRVGSVLGHKDTKTTQIYLGITVEREQRNSALAGKAMFPDMKRSGTVTHIRRKEA